MPAQDSPVVLEDVGQVCATVEPGRPIRIDVDLGCASGCAEGITAECSAEVFPEGLHVSARGSFIVPWDARDCIDCIPVRARCDGPVAQHKPILLRYGDLSERGHGRLCVGEPP